MTFSLAYANKDLAVKNGCLGCHAVNEKLVGPSYKDIATKYGGNPQAVEILTQNILQGGSGKWGEMAMPAQTGLSKKNAEKLSKWIMQGAN